MCIQANSRSTFQRRVATQLASVLSSCCAAAVGRDHFDPVLSGELLVERVRVVGFVADEPRREFVEEASGKNFFHKLALGWRSAFDRYGERKTVTSGDSDDLRALAAAGGADRKAPFFALAKVASTNASSRFNWPRSCRCLRQHLQRLLQLAAAHPLLEAAMTGLEGRILLRQLAPLRSGAEHPKHAVETQHAYHAKAGRDCPARRAAAAPAPPLPIARSVNSQRPCMWQSGAFQSTTRMPRLTNKKVYETGSRSFPAGRGRVPQAAVTIKTEWRCR